MSITRINVFSAKSDCRAELAKFLTDVIAVIRHADGCISCRLLSDQMNPLEFVILEVWESVAAHQKAAGMIPKEQIASVMLYLDKPPAGEYLSALS